MAPLSERNQTADRRGVFAPLKLWSYWAEVQHIFIQCSHIIADDPDEIGIAIFYSV